MAKFLNLTGALFFCGLFNALKGFLFAFAAVAFFRMRFGNVLGGKIVVHAADWGELCFCSRVQNAAAVFFGGRKEAFWFQ